MAYLDIAALRATPLKSEPYDYLVVPDFVDALDAARQDERDVAGQVGVEARHRQEARRHVRHPDLDVDVTTLLEDALTEAKAVFAERAN